MSPKEPPEEKPVNTITRIPPKLYARIKALAKEHDRSINWVLVAMLDESATRWEGGNTNPKEKAALVEAA